MRLALFLLAALALPAVEDAAVREPLENYLKGHATGDGASMRKAFLDTAHIEGLRAGKLTSGTVAGCAALFTSKPSSVEAKRKRWIERVEVTGTAAVATFRFEYPAADITDYMVLRQRNGKWLIANKVYSSRAKPQ